MVEPADGRAVTLHAMAAIDAGIAGAAELLNRSLVESDGSALRVAAALHLLIGLAPHIDQINAYVPASLDAVERITEKLKEMFGAPGSAATSAIVGADPK